MNFLNKGFLTLALLPKRAYLKLGVNYTHLQAILIAKLTMDDRRPNTLMQLRQQKSNKPVSTATIGAMVMSGVMGLFYLMVFLLGNDVVVQLTFYFSIFFFMLSAMLIADFTAVLIDVRDNYIIIPKPVNDRTVVVARLLHIFIHICKLVLPMSLPAFVFIMYHYGAWAGMVFMLMVLLITLFAIFFINAVYILILSITSPEKFKTIINYVQVIFAVAIFASYQILPRMMGNMKEMNLNLSGAYSSLALPFFWFAAGWKVLNSFSGNAIEIIGMVFSLLLPPLSLWVVVKFLAPTFNKKLSGINSVAAESKTITTVQQSKKTYAGFFGNLLTKKGAEQMGFLFTWKMTGRSKDFQLRVYPAFGYMIVFVVIFLMGKNKGGGFGFGEAGSIKPMLLSAIYLPSFLLITAIQQMNNSEKWKASWIYLISPVQIPGVIISGSIKAIVAKFYLPMAMVIIGCSLFLAGLKATPNLLLGIMNVMLITGILINIGKRQLPFSVQEANNDKGSNFMKAIMTLFCIAIITLLHYVVYNMLPVVIIFMVLSGIATWLLMDNIKKTSWDQLLLSAND